MIHNKTNNYLQFEKLNKEDDLIHLFTTRPFNFNKSFISEIEIDNQYNRLENLLNYKFIKIKKPIQTHTNIVKILNEENIDDEFEDVDGLITNLKGVALVTSLADCQGILLYDRVNKVIGNIHSGWKGTLNRIIRNAINLMVSTYGTEPSNIEAFICPSISKCHFEVSEDVKEMFEDEFKDIDINKYITKGELKENQKYYIDTIEINKNIMENLGLKEENITISNICTVCEGSLLHSYRTDKNESGRNISLICIK